MSLANERQPSGWPDVFGMTDPGLQHPHNEDHFLFEVQMKVHEASVP